MVVVTRAHVLFLAEELRHNDTERLSAWAMTGHSTDATHIIYYQSPFATKELEFDNVSSKYFLAPVSEKVWR